MACCAVHMLHAAPCRTRHRSPFAPTHLLVCRTGLRTLYDKYKDQGFELIGFPCNQVRAERGRKEDGIRDQGQGWKFQQWREWRFGGGRVTRPRVARDARGRSKAWGTGDGGRVVKIVMGGIASARARPNPTTGGVALREAVLSVGFNVGVNTGCPIHGAGGRRGGCGPAAGVGMRAVRADVWT